MTTHDQILSATEFATGKTGASLTSWIGAVAQRVAIWIDTCADYYAAAAMYEQLSRLSDAELARRGLSRPHPGARRARSMRPRLATLNRLAR